MNNKIKAIKGDISSLLHLFEEIQKVWDSDRNTMISVLLQNLSFDGSNTANYDEERTWQEMKQIQITLNALATYHGDDYLPKYIAEEVNMSFFGHEYVGEEIL